MKTLKQILAEGELIKFPSNKSTKPSGNWSWHKQPKSTMSDDEHFNKFMKDNVKSHPGHSSTETRSYESYCGHAEKHNHTPVDLPTFSRKMSAAGIHREKIAGAIRHIGVKVHDYGEDD